MTLRARLDNSVLSNSRRPNNVESPIGRYAICKFDCESCKRIGSAQEKVSRAACVRVEVRLNIKNSIPRARRRRRRVPDESDRRSSIQSINLIVNHLAALFIARIFPPSDRVGETRREKEAREKDQDGYTYYTRVAVQRERQTESERERMRRWWRGEGVGRTH